MASDKLIYMANQIATFFQSQPDDEAVAGLADHINKFWGPSMRHELLQRIADGEDGLKPLVIEASGLINPAKVRQTA